MPTPIIDAYKVKVFDEYTNRSGYTDKITVSSDGSVFIEDIDFVENNNGIQTQIDNLGSNISTMSNDIGNLNTHEGVQDGRLDALESATSGNHRVKVTLTRAQILALNTTAVELIAAPGANKVIRLTKVILHAPSTNFYSSGTLYFQYGAYNTFTAMAITTTNPANVANALDVYNPNALYLPVNSNINVKAPTLIVDSGTSSSIDVYIEYTIYDLTA